MKTLVLLLFSCFLCLSVTFAEDEITPKLEPNKAILEKIKNLKPNEACLLPGPAVLGQVTDSTILGVHNMNKFGPEGRDFCIKMAWMSDRKRAFFCGANHGAPHRLNDAWEYDLASNTWVLLYDPDYNDTTFTRSPEGIAQIKDRVILKDGFVQTTKGGPVHTGHTWWGLEYEPNLKKVFWYCVWPGEMQRRAKQFGLDESKLYKGPPFWTFDAEAKKWEPFKTEEPWGRVYGPGLSLVYVEDLKSLALQYFHSSDILNATEKKWAFNKNTEGGSIPIESLIYYDPSRKLFVASLGYPPSKEDPTKILGGKPLEKYKTWIAKLNGQKVEPWQLVHEGFDAPITHDARSTMHFDPKSKNGLCFSRDSRTVWSFNPDEKKWTKQEAKGDAIPTEDLLKRAVSYLDLERNVYVVIGQKWVWCYRYK